MALKARADGCPYDVVLMDVQMPVKDGLQATASLRAAGYNAPIIALTASALSSDRERAFEVGCDAFASKPIQRNELIETVRKAISSSVT